MFLSKHDSIAWAKNFLADLDGFMILDFETTGLPHDGIYPQPVSIAIIKVAPNISIDGYKIMLNQQLKPTCEIEIGASNVHGLTAELLADKPRFRDIYPDVVKLLHKEKLVIYNAAFDSPVLDSACDAFNLPYIKPLSVSCAMLSYSAFNGERHPKYKNYIWHKLTKAASYHGIAIDGAHDAAVDTILTYKLIQVIAKG